MVYLLPMIELAFFAGGGMGGPLYIEKTTVETSKELRLDWNDLPFNTETYLLFYDQR